MRTWMGWPVAEMLLADLYPTCGVAKNRPFFQAELRASIERDGMRNPLIGAVVTLEQWDDYWGKRNRPWLVDRPSGACIALIAGNQRYVVLQEMGCTHADVVLPSDVPTARELAAAQRQGFDELYVGE